MEAVAPRDAIKDVHALLEVLSVFLIPEGSAAVAMLGHVIHFGPPAVRAQHILNVIGSLPPPHHVEQHGLDQVPVVERPATNAPDVPLIVVLLRPPLVLALEAQRSRKLIAAQIQVLGLFTLKAVDVGEHEGTARIDEL